MNKIKVISEKLCNTFSTDQTYHLEQQSDGGYLKKLGQANKEKIESNLRKHGSIGVYQRNLDNRLKWICYDFDISKQNIESPSRIVAEKELNRVVLIYCNHLENNKIPYLLEFSGNRGYHIWIIFNNSIEYEIGYEILQLIINEIDLSYNSELIAIDLYPKSKKITSGVGSGVKIPLSKHKKSDYYSYLLSSKDEIGEVKNYNELTNELLDTQLAILNNHNTIDRNEIEKNFNTFLPSESDEHLDAQRIKSIRIKNIDLDKLMVYWKGIKPLNSLSKHIENGILNNKERKILVGIFHNVYDHNNINIGEKILLAIFSKTKNYNEKTTQRALKSLSSFYFPTQSQIEETLKSRFEKEYALDDLLYQIFNEEISYEHGFFDLCESDINIVRIAEKKYLVQNDEAQSRKIMNELAKLRNSEQLKKIKSIIDNNEELVVNYYEHERNEGNKTRTLISLDTTGRILTSSILKQFHYFYNMKNSNVTHGYRVNKGFKGGYIFKQWLFLWLKFLSNISSAIDDTNNKNHYIVKTDIKKFYDSIPHDKLKRLLLGGINDDIDDRISHLDTQSFNKYKNLVEIIFKITKKIVKNNSGLPQGPAYARFYAELYLDNIDKLFIKDNMCGDVISYQRYVDDIFFICKDENDAKNKLRLLKESLEKIGLEINQEKTIIKKVQDFRPEYDQYRSQSKYSVDKISHSFNSATPREKNLAINEFIKIISSHTCQDDLSFIYSHLNGVQEVESFKKEKIQSTINSGIGRGSLYKNLFNYILITQNFGSI